MLKVMATKVMTMQVSACVESDGDEGHGDEVNGVLSDELSLILYFSLLLLVCQILKVSRKYIIYETMVAICFIYYRIT